MCHNDNNNDNRDRLIRSTIMKHYHYRQMFLKNSMLPKNIVLIFYHFFLIMLLFLIKNAESAYNLPAGTMNQTGLTEIKETFKCEADGYFADVDNQCKIYHQCNSYNKKGLPSGKFHQTTMACGPGQIFDQSKFACKMEEDAIPCEASSDFFYLNDRIGDATADFLTDADIEKAQNARPEYRARAKRAKRTKSSKPKPISSFYTSSSTKWNNQNYRKAAKSSAKAKAAAKAKARAKARARARARAKAR